ncbi:hypothetical protein [Pseudoalteromonas aurantia]|uniref:Uncharacterized protein n=1 Tax=Pseudoalteromonas aurantia 208 TaxID=1314867 RepID=A0ABR9EH64_9GAMM|nr:hypothetical protein [Pseudoalteromonas aurantia]MBE0370348.1 hypothetical protein [Pseudoalteromonas aurantia 208]
MSISASVTLINKTGSAIKITQCSHVNDDATFSGISVGDVIENGSSEKLKMGNSSVFLAPRGCGCDISFICQSNFEIGNIVFDDPAVGAHSFSFGNTEVFAYTPGGDTSSSDYTVTVSLI